MGDETMKVTETETTVEPEKIAIEPEKEVVKETVTEEGSN